MNTSVTLIWITKKTHWVFKCRPKEIEIALLNPGWLRQTHQNSFTDGVSDCF